MEMKAMCGVLHCIRPGTEGKQRTICVHEHIEETYYCAICLARLQRGGLYCIPCHDSKLSHYCESRLITTDARAH